MEARPWQRHYDYDVPTTLRYPRIPAHQMMYVAAGAFPDKAALSFYGTETTFWELRLTDPAGWPTPWDDWGSRRGTGSGSICPPARST